MASARVIVVGAGPAGVRAAETLVESGLRPMLVDEAPSSGGQIYRRQPEKFRRAKEQLYGTEAGKACALHTTSDALTERIVYLPDTVAWNVYDGLLDVEKAAATSALPFDALIIAAGATDRVMAVPGWTLPGVYSLGAAQIALKAHACAIGRKVAFLGTGPLLYLVAYQYAKAGAEVAAVLDTSRASARLMALPALAIRLGTLAKGWSYLRYLRRRRVPMFTGVVPLAIEGNASAGVTAVVVRRGDGQRLVLDCDAVGLGHHLRPETQLADLAQCSFTFDELTRQWLPQIDEDGRTSIKSIYLAGDGARILGADGAEIQGRLAAYAALKDLGHPVPEKAVLRLRRARRRMDRFREGIAKAFPWPWELAASLPDDAIVCRCEAISAGEIRQVARQKGAAEINRAKAFSRLGMGRCQGRYCAHTAAELVADAAGVPIEAAGRLRSQAPVKPLPIAADSGATP
jgi:NADPH-dependent 2,4-dienoyl-CoA reductase/sulfur reductase-like enzyme